MNTQEIVQLVNDAINQMVADKVNQIELQKDNIAVLVEASARQIYILVYSFKTIGSLKMVDQEYATAKYDMRNHMYKDTINNQILHECVRKLLLAYKTGQLHLPLGGNQ